MPAEEARRIRLAFEQADVDGNGLISKDEVKMLFTTLAAFDDDQLDILFRAVDVDVDGMISIEEFTSWIMAEGGGAAQSVRVSIDKVVASTPSGQFVKPSFSVRDLAGYDRRSLPDDVCWLELREKLQKEGEVFRDEAFGPNDASLYGDSEEDLGDRAAAGERPNFKVDSWERIWDLAPECDRNGPIFKDGSSAHDIRQGGLGDCWFVSALAAVAESPALMARLVLGEQNINPEGIYAVRFWRDGAWRVVVVDDYLPCRKGKKPIFAVAKKGEFWVAIVEKAFAKLNGSYRAIKGGEQPAALYSLTGMLMPRTIKLRRYRPDKEDKKALFELMQDCAIAGGLLGCASKGKWDMGIAPLHAYTILGLHKVQCDGGKEALVHVRNPWGSGKEWRGKFSDGDAAWKTLSSTDKNLLGDGRERADGTWFMTFDDFCEHFFCVYLGQLFPAATHSFYHIATETVKGGKKPRVTVTLPSGGSVRIYYGGQDKRGLAEGAATPTLTMRCQRFQRDCPVERATTFKSKRFSEASVQVAKGETLVCDLGSTSKSRFYAIVVCPSDSEIVVDHGDGTVQDSKELDNDCDDDGDPDIIAMQSLVENVAEMTGWDARDQRAVVAKLLGSDIRSPQDFAAAVLDGNVNATFQKGSRFSKRTLCHLRRIAEEVRELEATISVISEQTGWSSQDQGQVVRKCIMIGSCSSEELADTLLEGDINKLLADVQQRPFGESSLAALKTWAAQWSEESEVVIVD